MEKIDIICYFDNNHKVLFDLFFYQTYNNYLSSNFNLKQFTKTVTNTDEGFQSKNWCSVMIERFDILKQYILENKNKWAIFSDIDIIFLNNFYKDIEKYFYQKEIEILYMCETQDKIKHNINGGFFLFKSSDYIYNFFDNIQRNIRRAPKPNDQVYIKKFLMKHRGFKNNILDPNIFVTNNIEKETITQLITNNQAKVFHATSAMSILAKVNILSAALCFKSISSTSNNLEKKSNLWI